MALMSKHRHSESEERLLKALTIDLTKPIASQEKILHTRYLNFALLYTLMGRHQEARENLAIGRRYVIGLFGEDTYYIAT